MASGKKVGWAQLRVGIVAIIALVLLAILVFLITGETSFFNPKIKLYTYLQDSAALAKGANVRLNGYLIGQVKNVGLSGQTEKGRIIQVEMEIYEQYRKNIPDNSEATISAENLLGSKYININRGDSSQMVKPGAELKAKDTTAYDEVVQSSYNLLQSMQAMLKRVDAIVAEVESGRGSIGKLIYDQKLYDNLSGTALEARKITAQINSGKGTISKLFYEEAMLDDIRGTLARVNSLLDDLQQGQGTMGRLLKDTALHDDLRKTLNEYRVLAADLNAGKGSAGKFLKDEATVKQIQATMGRIDTLLDKINTGQGTLGQLVVNQQLYDSINGATREMHSFMKDFRANPKKFLSIKLGLF
ncbi:MAG: MlaD family protein [Bryobacteraceae bacterium]